MSDAADKVRVFKDEAEEWRWAAFAANGEQIAASGEGYENHAHARKMAEALFPGVSVDDEADQEQ